MFALNYWLREFLLSAFANLFELKCEPKQLMLSALVNWSFFHSETATLVSIIDEHLNSHFDKVVQCNFSFFLLQKKTKGHSEDLSEAVAKANRHSFNAGCISCTPCPWSLYCSYSSRDLHVLKLFMVEKQSVQSA